MGYVVITSPDQALAPAAAPRQAPNAGLLTVAAASPRLAADPRGAARLAATLLAPRFARVRLIAPPRLPFGPSTSVSIDLGPRSDRLARVEIPAALAAPGTLLGTVRVPATTRRPALAIDLWTRFVRPWHRLAARLDDPRHSLAADLALAFSPALLLLDVPWHDPPLLISSPDMVGAELAGLALRRLDERAQEELPGPWEDPLVQRATELGLGARWPDELEIAVAPRNGLSTESAAVAASAQRIAELLGVPLLASPSAFPAPPT